MIEKTFFLVATSPFRCSMSNLFNELQRLFFLPEQQWHTHQAAAKSAPADAVDGLLTPQLVAESLAGESSVMLNLINAEGRVRVMVMVFEKTADWVRVASLLEVLQDELELPLPALSVSGRSGFRLWFSLAELVPVAQARLFLDGLHRKYLADMPPAGLQLRPATAARAGEAPVLVKLTPALHLTTGRWSAFIDPSLGSMFADEPGLAMAPNMDRQAQILAGLKCIEADDFQRVLGLLSEPVTPADVAGGAAVSKAGPCLQHKNDFSDPASFLLAVINDPSVATLERIRAAEALLPYFAKASPK
jgi:hypothetical protein